MEGSIPLCDGCSCVTHVTPDFEFRDPLPKPERRTRRGAALRMFGWSIIFLLMFGAGVSVSSLIHSQRLSLQSVTEEKQERLNPTETKSIDTPAGTLLVHAERIPMAATEASPNQQAWSNAVVTVETTQQPAHILGSGVIVAETGQVLTNWHVIRDCVEAQVRLRDGTTYIVREYAALHASHDLALLALHDAPTTLPGIHCAETEPAVGTKVWAIGHPQGFQFSVTSGEVSRNIQSGHLPTSAQQFLQTELITAANAYWIQHTARVAVGNSGGPLFNEAGELLGINTWQNEQTGFSYAIAALHIREFLKDAPQTKSISLLAGASAHVRAEHEWVQLTPNTIQQILDNVRDFKWQPTSVEEYRKLQSIARVISLTHDKNRFWRASIATAQREAIQRMADAILKEIRERSWNDPIAITLVNELAAESVTVPWHGQFLFVRVEHLVEGKQGERGIVATLSGFDQPLFLSLEADQLSVPKAGATCLVVGVNQEGNVVKYGENPLQPTVAPIIETTLLIPLQLE
jgi:S1-C subfamily serine protease